MKICPNCNAQLDDAAAFCTNCGVQFAEQPQPQPQPQYPPQGAVPPYPGYAPAPVYDAYDHTAEFDPKDISENKVFAILGYLLGVIGIIVALLAAKSSGFVMFHVRQALKFAVVDILLAICVLLLFWTVIIPIAYGIITCILLVIKIICFFQACSGKAKEPAIIRSLGFLK